MKIPYFLARTYALFIRYEIATWNFNKNQNRPKGAPTGAAQRLFEFHDDPCFAIFLYPHGIKDSFIHQISVQVISCFNACCLRLPYIFNFLYTWHLFQPNTQREFYRCEWNSEDFCAHFLLGSPDISYFISTDFDRNQLLWPTCNQDLPAVASI